MSGKKKKDKEDVLEMLKEALEDVEEEKEEKFDKDEEEDEFFRRFKGLIGTQVLIITDSQQLNLLGQTFRPIFCGTIVEVEQGLLTLYPANIKLLNAPFYHFPTPLSIPFEKVTQFTTEFDCDMRIPLV